MKIHNDQNGFAMIYGLIVLFAASLTGFSLMYLAGKDKVASVDYIKARTSSIAAQAALKACERRLTNQSNIAVVILNKYSKDTTRKWFLSDSNKTNQEIKIKMDPSQSNSPRFSVRIAAFDPKNGILKVEGIGYGMGEGKKSVIGMYILSGVQIEQAAIPRHALYLGKGFGNCDNPMVIYGDVFAGGNSMINNNGGSVEINGNFKTGTGSFTTNEQLTINGNAFFRGNSKFQNKDPSVNGSAGFSGGLDLESKSPPPGFLRLTVAGNFYINGNITGPGSVTVNGTGSIAQYYTGGCFNSIKISPAPTGVTAPIDIANKLEMANVDDATVTVRNDLETYIENNGGHVYDSPFDAGIHLNRVGWDLDNAYASGLKWNGFLVVKITSNAVNFDKTGGILNNKIIWIISGLGTSPTADKWYSSGPNSNTLICLKDGAKFNNFGGTNMNSFRGLIYSSSSEQTQFSLSSGSVNGAIICTGASIQFQQVPGAKDTLRYGNDVIDEFINLGILSIPGGGGGVDSTRIVLNDTRIRPELLGMSY